jgi:hypothetical protein
MIVESISSLMVHLYEVGQLRYGPAGMTRADIITCAQVENRPGGYNQDTTMADWYKWIFDKRAAC